MHGAHLKWKLKSPFKGIESIYLHQSNYFLCLQHMLFTRLYVQNTQTRLNLLIKLCLLNISFSHGKEQ